jgi:hypothetical protein
VDSTQITLTVLLVLTAGVAIWGYPRKYGALSGRSRLYRTAGVGVLVFLLTLILVGTYTDFYAGVTRQIGALRAAAHLGAVLILVLSLPFIALLDALETYVTGRREKRALLEQMIREEIERAQAKAAEKKTAQTTQTATVVSSGAQAIQQVGGGGEQRER